VPYPEHAEGGFRVLLRILRANALFRLTGHTAVRQQRLPHEHKLETYTLRPLDMMSMVAAPPRTSHMRT